MNFIQNNFSFNYITDIIGAQNQNPLKVYASIISVPFICIIKFNPISNIPDLNKTTILNIDWN